MVVWLIVWRNFKQKFSNWNNFLEEWWLNRLLEKNSSKIFTCTLDFRDTSLVSQAAFKKKTCFNFYRRGCHGNGVCLGRLINALEVYKSASKINQREMNVRLLIMIGMEHGWNKFFVPSSIYNLTIPSKWNVHTFLPRPRIKSAVMWRCEVVGTSTIIWSHHSRLR